MPPNLASQCRCHFRDAVLVRQIRCLRPNLMIAQNADDLVFRERCSLHLSALLSAEL